MAPTSKHIIIAGAGIGGLTAAIALAADGHRVEILEQAAAITAIGAGVTLAPNAMRVYRALGLEEALCAAGVEPSRQRIQHWRDGHILHALERGNSMREIYQAPYLTIHRADLQDALLARLATFGDAVTIRLSATAVAARVEANSAIVELETGALIAGDAVIAADGIKSRLRRAFSPAPAHFTGHIAWRAVVPVQGDILQGLADFPGMHIGPGRMVVRYPVRRGTHLNLVFFARQQGWAEEGWAIPGLPAELEATFGDWSPEIAALRAAIDPASLFKWAICAHSPLPTWISGGRIALMGDAAHAMTPFMGQGAGCAIEDAMVISRCLAMDETVGAALLRYEAARQQRCTFIQAESNANAERIQGAEAELYGLKNMRNEETLGLFAYDATTVDLGVSAAAPGE